MKKVKFFLFFSLIITAFISSEDLVKKYYNNVFHGGKERFVFQYPDDRKLINVKYCNITVDLFPEYASLNIVYEISAKDRDVNCEFMFPKIDSFINKSTYSLIDENKDDVLLDSKLLKKEGNYDNFSISVNGESVKYKIETSDMLELEIPYRLGDEKEYFDEKMNLYKESVESFTFLYGWYTIPLIIKEKEKLKINITYNCGYYYNENYFDHTRSAIEIEDPALRYEYTESSMGKTGVSEKIFSYLFFTSYSLEEQIVYKTYFKLISHLIDSDILKIIPSNYKQRGIRYYWSYKRLKAKPSNNITVSLFPSNSRRLIPLHDFKFNLVKKRNYKGTYYEMNKNDDLVIEYNVDGDTGQTYGDDTVTVNEIRIAPNYFTDRDQIDNSNIPLEFEIAFSMTENFNDVKKYVEKFDEKDFYDLIDKTSYLSIYKGKPVECKFIRIRILNTSYDNNNIVKIRDIEIMRK